MIEQIKKDWETFNKQVVLHDTPEDARMHLRLAFFAGAFAQAYNVLELLTGTSELKDSLRLFLHDIKDHLDTLSREMKQKQEQEREPTP